MTGRAAAPQRSLMPPAGVQKVFAADPRLGFLAHASVRREGPARGEPLVGAASLEATRRLVFNDVLNATGALLFMGVAALLVAASIREWYLVLRGRKPAVSYESPFVSTAPAPAAGR